MRTDDELLDKLEAYRKQQSKKIPGVTLSTADVARALLQGALARQSTTDEEGE